MDSTHSSRPGPSSSGFSTTYPHLFDPSPHSLPSPLSEQLGKLFQKFCPSKELPSELDLLEILTGELSQILKKKEKVTDVIFGETLQTINTQVEQLDFRECLENETLYQLAILKAQLGYLLGSQESPPLLLESNEKVIPFSANHQDLPSSSSDFISLDLEPFYAGGRGLDEAKRSLFLYYAIGDFSRFYFPSPEVLFIFFRWARDSKDEKLQSLCEKNLLKIVDEYETAINGSRYLDPDRATSQLLELIQLAINFCQTDALNFLKVSEKDWLYSLIQSVHAHKTKEQFQLEDVNNFLKDKIALSKKFCLDPKQQKRILQDVRYMTGLAEELGLLFLDAPFEDCSLILHWIEKDCPESEEWLGALEKAESCYLSGDFSLDVLKKILRACPNLSNLRVEHVSFHPENLLRYILETRPPLKNLFCLSTWKPRSLSNTAIMGLSPALLKARFPDIPALLKHFHMTFPYKLVDFQNNLTKEDMLLFVCNNQDEDAQAKMREDLETLNF